LSQTPSIDACATSTPAAVESGAEPRADYWLKSEVLAALEEADLGLFATDAEVMALAKKWCATSARGTP
jgi:predicted transcriptional regulator